VRHVRAVWWLIGFASAIFFVGWVPLPNSLLAKLEHAHTQPQISLNGFVGAVVLGGNGRSMYAAISQHQIDRFKVTERMVQAVQLVRAHPHLRVLHTNGTSKKRSADPALQNTPSQAERFFLSTGIEAQKLFFERSSTNTFENAVLSGQLDGVEITQPWLLVTSAAHMPRAMATFERAGWNVTAYPVDYQSEMALPWHTFSLVDGASLWQNLIYELLAWAKYKLLGWV
jgi:uncharacterized SAM-binding protein YcdF (DUF218 family)